MDSGKENANGRAAATVKFEGGGREEPSKLRFNATH